MSEINENDFDFNVDEPKASMSNEGENKYESYRPKKKRKVSNLSLIFIIIEIGFIGITFILTLRKAISIVINKNPIQNEISYKKELTTNDKTGKANYEKKEVKNDEDYEKNLGEKVDQKDKKKKHQHHHKSNDKGDKDNNNNISNDGQNITQSTNNTQNQTSAQNITNNQNQTQVQNITNIQNQTQVQNITNIQNQTQVQNITNTQNQTLAQNITNTQNQTLVQNITNTQNQTLVQNITNTQNQTLAQNITNIQNQTLAQNITNTQNQTLAQNITNIQNQTLVQNITNTQNQTLAQNITNIQNQTQVQNITNNQQQNIVNDNNVIKGVNQEIQSKNQSTPNIRICLCTHGKKENNYLKEFVEYYINMGVDRIYIYNRNAQGGEETLFNTTPLKEFMESDKVRLEDWRGKGSLILDMMNHCYANHYGHYDWILFYEPDEFIHLNGINNIKTFLVDPKFEQCKKIYLNWVIHTDNDLYHYEDKPVQLRFPKILPKPQDPNNTDFNVVKSIFRGKQENIKIDCLYRLNKMEDGCNGYGKIAKMKSYKMIEPDYDNFYIDHYFSKSVDEFIENIDKEDLDNNDIRFKNDLENYFKINNMTNDKIKYIEEKTKLDLSKYKK